MSQTVSREIREAAEQAEAKAKASAAAKDFEKAADYFSFAGQTYKRIAEAIKDTEKKERVLKHVGKLQQMEKQCRAADRRKSTKLQPAAEAPKPEASVDIPESDDSEDESSDQPEEETKGGVDIPAEESEEDPVAEETPEQAEEGELSLATEEGEAESAEEATEDIDVPEDPPEEDESEEEEAPPAKAGLKLPMGKGKRGRRGKLLAKGPVLPPGKKRKPSTRVGAPVVAAPKPAEPPKVVSAPAPAAKVVDAPAAKPAADQLAIETPVAPTADSVADADVEEFGNADDTLDELPEGFEPLPGPVAGAPVLGPKDIPSSNRQRAVVSEGDLEELAGGEQRPSTRNASVVISLDAGDFPEEIYDPDKFSIALSPRFTEHLCKALVVGDLSQIASKFNKLADNLIRKAMAGDPRDELDLRFTALACREAADRLLDEPPGDPTSEIDAARKAYRSGDFKSAAAQYKQAAMRLLGREGEDDADKLGLRERQASEFLSFSSRLRAVGDKK